MKCLLASAFFLIQLLNGFSQFEIVGNAYAIPVNSSCDLSDTCFTLTDNFGQSGAVYHQVRFDLSRPFDGIFCLYLGDADENSPCYDDTEDSGADGFAFVLKDTNAMPLGQLGGGLGFEGISPSVAIEFDTYPNPSNGDVGNVDHTALYFNGNQGNTIAGPVPLHPAGNNMEDGNYHYARLVWNPVTFELSMYFDGVLRFSHQHDIVNNIFGGNPIVDWGFTASTGGCYNIQQICFPAVDIDLEPLHVICEDDSVLLGYFAENLTSYTWTGPSGTIIDWNINDGISLTDTAFYTQQEGAYLLEIVQNNIPISGTTNIIVAKYPTFNRPETTIFCPRDNRFFLDASNNVDCEFLWSPNGETTPLIEVDTTGFYAVTITEPINNCQVADTITITSYCSPIVALPNVFTPNADGFNDKMFPIIYDWVGELESLRIYNRWGKMVYESSENFWDGSINDKYVDGVYFYEFTYLNLWKNESTTLTGFVHVLGS